MSILTRIADRFRRLRAARDGNVMIMFGVGGIVLFCAAGVAVDMARAYSVRLRLNAALDAAGLAVAALPGSATTAQQNAQLQAFFDANYPASKLGGVANFVPTMSISGNQITVSATATINTVFMQVFPGAPSTMTVGATSVIAKGTGLELALALDNTGSMFSNNNIQALRDDTTLLLNTLFTNTNNQNQLYVSIVPFVTAVNLPPSLVKYVGTNTYLPYNAAVAGSAAAPGPLAYDATQSDDTKWKGCPMENPYPSDINPQQTSWPGQFLWPYFDYQHANPSAANVNLNNSDNVLDPPPLPKSAGGPNWNVAANAPNAAPDPRWAQTNITPVASVNDHTNFFTAGNNTDCNWNAALNKDCPTQITPLTKADAAGQTTLLNAANAMQAWCQSGTMIHIGLAWGWRTLEPNGIFGDASLAHVPAAYTDTNWLKALVLMTDGQDVMFQGCDQTFSYVQNNGGVGSGVHNSPPAQPPYAEYFGAKDSSGNYTLGQASGSCNRSGSTKLNTTTSENGYPPPVSGMTPYGRLGDDNSYFGKGVPDPNNNGNPSAGVATSAAAKPLLDNEVTIACANLKQLGVRVYTIAFTGAAANSIVMLQACASDPNRTFFNAPDQATLKAAFVSIANDLNKIRVIK